MIKIKKLFKNEKDLEQIIKLSYPNKTELKDYKLVKVNRDKIVDGVPTYSEIRQIHIDILDNYELFLSISEDGYVTKENWSGSKFKYYNALEIAKILLTYEK
tara:strand:- start:732 stop:1037 length:306 start_codon:yes stop_codon:yes gene_type:complete